MRRITLTFQLGCHEVQANLLREFALHQDVIASAAGTESVAMIAVETADTPSALWDVRATVGMFDDRAQEVGAQ